MKLTARLGIAMILVSAVTLAPAVMASTGSSSVECGAKSGKALNVRSPNNTKDVITAALGSQSTNSAKGRIIR